MVSLLAAKFDLPPANALNLNKSGKLDQIIQLKFNFYFQRLWEELIGQQVSITLSKSKFMVSVK